MLAADLIDPMLPMLKTTDTVAQALDWMQEHQMTQLILTDQGEYGGIVSEENLLALPDDSMPLGGLPQSSEQLYVRAHQHLLEVLQLALQHRLAVVAVLDEQTRACIGTISTKELLEQFARELGMVENGAILILKLSERDYSLAEISRLIESNNVRIISSYYVSAAYGMPDHSRLTLKLNRREVSPVVATLERFGYQVEAAFASDPIESIDQDRLQSLLHYLNV